MTNDQNFNYITFFTATILNWNSLLINDKYKDIIIDSLKFLVINNRIDIYAFVIMPSHLHFVWKIKNDMNPADIQRDFLKFTAQKIKFKLMDVNSSLLSKFCVNAGDRAYQIWERNPLSSRLPNKEIVEQKINYIHANPMRGKWKLCNEVTDYKYSSAKFYYGGVNEWDFLKNFSEAFY